MARRRRLYALALAILAAVGLLMLVSGGLWGWAAGVVVLAWACALAVYV